jgi:hypothetical protein
MFAAVIVVGGRGVKRVIVWLKHVEHLSLDMHIIYYCTPAAVRVQVDFCRQTSVEYVCLSVSAVTVPRVSYSFQRGGSLYYSSILYSVLVKKNSV